LNHHKSDVHPSQSVGLLHEPFGRYDGALIHRPPQGAKYRLSDLLAEVTEENLHPVVEWGASVGREEL